MLKLKDVYDKIKELESYRFNGSLEYDELVEELILKLEKAGRLMMTLNVYDDADNELSEEEWDIIIESF